MAAIMPLGRGSGYPLIYLLMLISAAITLA